MMNRGAELRVPPTVIPGELAPAAYWKPVEPDRPVQEKMTVVEVKDRLIEPGEPGVMAEARFLSVIPAEESYRASDS